MVKITFATCWCSVLLWIIWATASFSYYGVVLMSAELLESSGELCSLQGGQAGDTCSAQVN